METAQFTVMNPLLASIEEAKRITAQLDEASEELQSCITDERTWFSRLKEAQDTYEMMENEIVGEVVIAAQLKEGPLANIATTSKAYDIALSRVKTEARNGALNKQWTALSNVRRGYEAAQIDLARAETRFKALMRMAELMNGILRASSI
jgi:hypothetical protein